MSGSGGGGGRPSRPIGGSGGPSGGGPGGSGPGGAVDCSRLIFETVVGSPDPGTLSEVAPGDVCDVVLAQNPTRIVLLTRPAGHLLGAIVNRWEELLGCLEQGVQFDAVVRSTESPVKVLVRPAF